MPLTCREVPGSLSRTILQKAGQECPGLSVAIETRGRGLPHVSVTHRPSSSSGCEKDDLGQCGCEGQLTGSVSWTCSSFVRRSVSHFKLRGLCLETYTCLDCHHRETGMTVTEDSATSSNGSQTVWCHSRRYQVFRKPDTGGNEQKHSNAG